MLRRDEVSAEAEDDEREEDLWREGMVSEVGMVESARRVCMLGNGEKVGLERLPEGRAGRGWRCSPLRKVGWTLGSALLLLM